MIVSSCECQLKNFVNDENTSGFLRQDSYLIKRKARSRFLMYSIFNIIIAKDEFCIAIQCVHKYSKQVTITRHLS